MRGDQSAPDRRDIEPFDISRALANLLMLNADENAPTVRFAGTRLTSALGRELRGTNFLTLWSADDRRRVREALDFGAACPAGVQMEFTMHTLKDRSLAMEAIVLPLRFGGTRIQRFVGAIAPVATPYWLGADAMRHLQLDKVCIFPTRAGASLSPAHVRDHPVFNRPQPVRQIRHLAVYEGGLE